MAAFYPDPGTAGSRRWRAEVPHTHSRARRHLSSLLARPDETGTQDGLCSSKRCINTGSSIHDTIDTEIVVQRALEKHPGERPRIISDNGPQFIARDFKTFIRLMGLTHVRTSPYYPQSNGKLERWHGSIKRECIRPACPGSLEEALRLVSSYVEDYNHRRLHSALGYVAPADKLNGLDQVIFAERDRKLEEARQRRRQTRLALQAVA